jgi:tRNA pseudouridine38-40 synthase
MLYAFLEIKRVTKGFNSKVQCDSRSYIYLLPTVSFIPYEQMMVQKGFRVDEAVLDRVNTILQKFVGTKKFSQFHGKKTSDGSERQAIYENVSL